MRAKEAVNSLALQPHVVHARACSTEMDRACTILGHLQCREVLPAQVALAVLGM